jgi:plasmid stabilization system protein ParE
VSPRPALIIHPEAAAEARRARLCYEARSARAAQSFMQKPEVAMDHILDRPESWPVVNEPYRRYLMQRFPFGLIYRYDADSDTVTIFAVAHLKRRPGYWADRPV